MKFNLGFNVKSNTTKIKELQECLNYQHRVLSTLLNDNANLFSLLSQIIDKKDYNSSYYRDSFKKLNKDIENLKSSHLTQKIMAYNLRHEISEIKNSLVYEDAVE